MRTIVTRLPHALQIAVADASTRAKRAASDLEHAKALCLEKNLRLISDPETGSLALPWRANYAPFAEQMALVRNAQALQFNAAPPASVVAARQALVDRLAQYKQATTKWLARFGDDPKVQQHIHQAVVDTAGRLDWAVLVAPLNVEARQADVAHGLMCVEAANAILTTVLAADKAKWRINHGTDALALGCALETLDKINAFLPRMVSLLLKRQVREEFDRAMDHFSMAAYGVGA